MSIRSFSRRRFLGALLLLTGGSFLVVPADARPPRPPRFFDATGADPNGETTVWFAKNGSKAYGLLAQQGGFSLAEATRLGGTVRQNNVTGRLYNGDNRRTGTFRATLDGPAIAGTYTQGTSEPVTWQGTEVTRDAAVMQQLNGRFRAQDIESVDVDLNLNARSSSFTLTGTARLGFITARVATVSGRWIADTEGNVWLLPLKAQYRNISGGPEIDLPREGVVVKLGYELQTNGFNLADPFDPTDVFLSLRRR